MQRDRWERERYLPVVRRKTDRITLYAIGRVVEYGDEPTCPVCGARIVILAFEEAALPGTIATRTNVVPYDPAPEREPSTRFDDLLPTPHAWSCRRTHQGDPDE